ncbi:MAG: DNA polymerase III subunit beta [Chloroflexia bacterium]|nr:DNA polymerase III subunit beta [Chloroflexia bacterium]
MRVTCLQENLHRALGTAGRAVASKSTLPILGNFLLNASGDNLVITATNLEMGIRYTIPAKVQEEGRVTLQARVLNDFVASLSSGEMELLHDQGPLTVLVKQGNTQAHVRGIDPEDFPPLTEHADEGTQFEVDASVLRESIEHVVFAAASDDSRPVLAGVQLEVKGNKLQLAAADGFRMSVRTVTLDQPLEADVSIIIPARAMGEMSRVLSDASEPARISITPNQTQLYLSLPDIVFVTRLIDGTFPDLKQIIPTTWNTRSIVLRDTVLDAARRAAIFARSANDVVKFEIQPPSESLEMGQVTITANAADTGDNRDDIDAQVEGEPTQIAFNGRYLTDVLSVMRSASVAFELQGANAAGVIKSEGSDDFVHVIMPMVIGAS